MSILSFSGNRRKTRQKVVVIGGGTGSHEVLAGLKNVTNDITALVNMCDDGGSTGRLRHDYDVMPPGDLRQCLVALANDTVAAGLFAYRFEGGELAGHPAGNIALAALEKQHGIVAAVEVAGRMLDIAGRVLPATITQHQLVMQDGNETIRGQEAVRLHVIHEKSVDLHLEPNAALHPEAAQAISEADIVVIAPGGLYWTLLPVLSLEGMAEALQQTPGKVICVVDLMNRPEQHQGWHVVDYVKAMGKLIGEDTIDTVLYNNRPITEELRLRYATAGEMPVGIASERFSELNAVSVGADLVAVAPDGQDKADTAIRRTLIRHDGIKTAAAIQSLL